jgi:hypothetical protein
LGRSEIDRLGENERYWMAKYDTLFGKKQELLENQKKIHQEIKLLQSENEVLKYDKRKIIDQLNNISYPR